MDSRAQSINLAELDVDNLLSFIDELRESGYNIGVDQHIAVQDILLGLGSGGLATIGLETLCRLLGPIVCNTAKEQEDFRLRFTSWAEQFVIHVPPPPLPKPVVDLEFEEIEHKSQWVGLGLAGLVVVALLYFLSVSSQPQGTVEPVISLPTPVIALDDPSILTAIAIAPTATTVPSPTPRPTETPRGVTRFRKVWPSLLQTIEETIPHSEVGEDLVSFRMWVTIWIMFVLLAALGMWRTWWYYQANQFLHRRNSNTTPNITQVRVKQENEGVFANLSIIRIAQQFRRRTDAPSSELDVDKTLHETLKSGGWLKPIYGRRQMPPEYIFLVNRANYRDQQAHYVDLVIQQLQENEVFVTKFYFDGDPRRCFPAESRGRPIALQDLAARFGDYRLVIFTDTEKLFSPLTGELEPWIELFDAWTHRSLLTPEPVAQWGYWEHELATKFRVFPLTNGGLGNLALDMQGDNIVLDSSFSPSTPFPSMLRIRPMRWLQDDSPEPKLIDDMLRSLRRYLGAEGYYWLSACAVYPELNWNLTLYFGNTLTNVRDEPLFESGRLLTLTRLPWFRFGSMPDWLRARLIVDLPQNPEQKIRTSLQSLLLSVIQGSSSDFELNVARSHKRVLGGLTRPLIHLLRKQNQNTSLDDRVFMDFMGGPWKTQLAIRVPEMVRNLLLGKAQSEYEPRTPFFIRLLRKKWGETLLSIITSIILLLIAAFIGTSLVNSATNTLLTMMFMGMVSGSFIAFTINLLQHRNHEESRWLSTLRVTLGGGVMSAIIWGIGTLISGSETIFACLSGIYLSLCYIWWRNSRITAVVTMIPLRTISALLSAIVSWGMIGLVIYSTNIEAAVGTAIAGAIGGSSNWFVSNLILNGRETYTGRAFVASRLLLSTLLGAVIWIAGYTFITASPSTLMLATEYVNCSMSIFITWFYIWWSNRQYRHDTDGIFSLRIFSGIIATIAIWWSSGLYLTNVIQSTANQNILILGAIIGSLNWCLLELSLRGNQVAQQLLKFFGGLISSILLSGAAWLLTLQLTVDETIFGSVISILFNILYICWFWLDVKAEKISTVTRLVALILFTVLLWTIIGYLGDIVWRSLIDDQSTLYALSLMATIGFIGGVTNGLFIIRAVRATSSAQIILAAGIFSAIAWSLSEFLALGSESTFFAAGTSLYIGWMLSWNGWSQMDDTQPSIQLKTTGAFLSNIIVWLLIGFGGAAINNIPMITNPLVLIALVGGLGMFLSGTLIESILTRSDSSNRILPPRQITLFATLLGIVGWGIVEYFVNDTSFFYMSKNSSA